LVPKSTIPSQSAGQKVEAPACTRRRARSERAADGVSSEALGGFVDGVVMDGKAMGRKAKSPPNVTKL